MEQPIRLNWQALIDEAVSRRKSQKLTQTQLAVIAGISKPTVIDFEKGRTTIKLESVFKILKVLGLLA